jgi:tetratricopeptide (TPR) repeat protein
VSPTRLPRQTTTSPAESHQPAPNSSTNRSERPFPTVLPMLVLVFFIASTAFFIFVVGVTAWNAYHPVVDSSGVEKSTNPKDDPKAIAKEKDEVLKIKIDAYEKRAEDLEKLTALLTGLSVLYALALGVTSYIGLQNSLQQAKAIGDELEALRTKAVTQLDEAESKATEVVHQIRDEFPLFGYVDANLRRITRDFLRIMPFKGWSDHIYKNLKPQTTEEILFYEKTAASLEFFDLRSIRTEVSQIYEGLGVFYALKCQHQRKYLQQDSALELGRSKFYLDRATKADPENFSAWNDCAWVALVLDSPPSLAQARQFSLASLKIVDKQQRAEYNLSVAEHLSGNFSLAEERLSRALSQTKWEEEEYVGRVHNLYYNRACARSRLSKNPTNDPKARTAETLVNEALEDLMDAFGPSQREHWDTDDWKAAVGDCLKGEDLDIVTRKHAEIVVPLLSQDFKKVDVEERRKGLASLENDLNANGAS